VGFDLTCVPVRLDSAAVRLMRDDADSWAVASEYPPFSRIARGSPPPVSRRLLAALPPGANRWSPFPDRAHGQAEFLLDPRGYLLLSGWEERQRSLPYRIVYGDRPFAPHARGVQGVAWRCSTAAFLQLAAAAIEALDETATHRLFRTADMVAAGVYKARAETDDDVAFDSVLSALRRLGREYRRIAASGLDLIIEKD
jgi:hypothetical protein